MARDIKFRGQGVGDIMIDHVISTANNLAQEIGCRLIIVDSEPDSVACYQRNGFQALPTPKDAGTIKMYLDLWRPHTKCKRCGNIYPSTVIARKIEGEGKFIMKCPKCGNTSEYTTKDYYFN